MQLYELPPLAPKLLAATAAWHDFCFAMITPGPRAHTVRDIFSPEVLRVSRRAV